MKPSSIDFRVLKLFRLDVVGADVSADVDMKDARFLESEGCCGCEEELLVADDVVELLLWMENGLKMVRTGMEKGDEG